VPPLKAALGSGGRVARHRGAEGNPQGRGSTAGRGGESGLRRAGLQEIHGRPWLRRCLPAAGGVRQVHGEVVERPIAAGLGLLALLVWLWPLARALARRRRTAA